MGEPHSTEWESTALATVGSRGRRPAGARRAVVELLSRQRCCLSAQEISDELRAGGARVGTASVYRALDLLQGEGLVTRIEVGDGGARYEPALPGGDHHHHVVCDACASITPFEDRALERAIHAVSSRIGHEVSGHDVLIKGLCGECAARRR